MGEIGRIVGITMNSKSEQQEIERVVITLTKARARLIARLDRSLSVIGKMMRERKADMTEEINALLDIRNELTKLEEMK